MQKTAVRNISLTHYNSHTDPLFKRYKILKFDDLVTISVGSFIFNVSMGNQPNTISEVFNKNVNFNRNLDFILERVPYSYLHKIVPYSQVKIWNQIHSGHRNWLKEKPEQVNKSLLAPPKKIPQVNNKALNNYRLNGFKSSLTDSILDTYKIKVHCNNHYCRDCN